MRTSAKALALATVALALWAAPAEAGWKMSRAQKIAAIVWNHPCANGVAIEWAHSVPTAAADADNCVVWFNSTDHVATEWPIFCTEMIHEYGHLARFRDPLNTADPQHSHNPRSVMFGGVSIDKHTVHVAGGRTTTTWIGEDLRCRGRGRRYLEAHGVLTSRTSRRSPAPDPTRRAAARRGR